MMATLDIKRLIIFLWQWQKKGTKGIKKKQCKCSTVCCHGQVSWACNFFRVFCTITTLGVCWSGNVSEDSFSSVLVTSLCARGARTGTWWAPFSSWTQPAARSTGHIVLWMSPVLYSENQRLIFSNSWFSPSCSEIPSSPRNSQKSHHVYSTSWWKRCPLAWKDGSCSRSKLYI